MQPFTLALITLTLAAAGPVHAAGEIHVPGDHPDPQSAIHAALPGDLIVVHGGTWGPITIDKPLHLLGDPTPLFEGSVADYWGEPYVSPITLAGPGFGVVTLSSVQTGGSTGSTADFLEPGVSGGGFAELRIFDSTLRAPAWSTGDGAMEGAVGLSVSVPFVLLERSTVEASKSISTSGEGGWDGVDGIVAPASTVVVLDSTVKGGAPDRFACIQAGRAAASPPLPTRTTAREVRQSIARNCITPAALLSAVREPPGMTGPGLTAGRRPTVHRPWPLLRSS